MNRAHYEAMAKTLDRIDAAAEAADIAPNEDVADLIARLHRDSLRRVVAGNDPAAALAKMRDELKESAALFKAMRTMSDAEDDLGESVRLIDESVEVALNVVRNTAAPLITVIDAVLASVAMKDAEIAELRKECKEMRALSQLGTHRVIACGVAATHPDASLMDRGAYADEWRTRQSDEVRELRRDRDALRARLAKGNEA